MAKKFACKNIGLACNFETSAENEEALLAQVKEHARTSHKMEQIDEATMSKVKSSIQEA
jgi:predicted small metal-binding protein